MLFLLLLDSSWLASGLVSITSILIVSVPGLFAFGLFCGFLFCWFVYYLQFSGL